MNINIYPTVVDSFTTFPSTKDYRKYGCILDCFILNRIEQILTDKWSQGKLFVLCLNSNADTLYHYLLG